MKAIGKKYYQDFVDQIDFPTTVYTYETGKIIAYNSLAEEILGNKVHNMNKIWIDNQKIRFDQRFLEGESLYLNNKKVLLHGKVYDEVDFEFNCIKLDHVHIVIAFFDLSYKQSFIRHMKKRLPRLAWKNKKMEYLGMNMMFREDNGIREDQSLPYATTGVFDEATCEKLMEDEEFILSSKSPMFNTIQLLTTPTTIGNFCRLHRVPLINRNGTVVGVVEAYTHILNREEYQRMFDLVLNENHILSKLLCSGDKVILVAEKEVEVKVKYVSANIYRLGFTPQNVYDETIPYNGMFVQEERAKFHASLLQLEKGILERFEQIVQLKTPDKQIIRVHISVALITNCYNRLCIQCFLKEIKEEENQEYLDEN